MVDVLVVILVLAVNLGMSWAVTVGLIKLVTIFVYQEEFTHDF